MNQIEANPVISARDLTKHYGEFEAVRGIDFSVEPAQCIGLLGPNGAGKSSTLRMIMGLSTVTGGSLEVFGRPVQKMDRATKSKIGLVPQETNLDPDITVIENLQVYGRYFGLSPETLAGRIPKLLQFMQLEEKVNARVMMLSGGMKRRLIIARALIAEPELVVLDEPTTGLDPQARVLIWKQLLELKKDGRTLLLTTHYMDEAQRLCDRIVIIDNGQILDQGTPNELIARHAGGHVFEVEKPNLPEVTPEQCNQEDIGDTVLYFVLKPNEFIETLPDHAVYMHRQANLEDVFLRLTGRVLREP